VLVKVVLRNPRRELEVRGPKTVTALLAELDLNPESVLVISDEELVPKDARLADGATVEIRPVLSGGASDRGPGIPVRSERPMSGASDRGHANERLRTGYPGPQRVNPGGRIPGRSERPMSGSGRTA